MRDGGGNGALTLGRVWGDCCAQETDAAAAGSVRAVHGLPGRGILPPVVALWQRLQLGIWVRNWNWVRNWIWVWIRKWVFRAELELEQGR